MECYETVMRESDVIGRLEEVLDFVVEHQHDGTASTSEDVGEGSLEEGTSTWNTYTTLSFVIKIDIVYEAKCDSWIPFNENISVNK